MKDNGTVSIRHEEIAEIMDMANSLKGEEAVEGIIRFIDCPKDSMTGDIALKSIIRFYSNVRYLRELIQDAFNNGGC